MVDVIAKLQECLRMEANHNEILIRRINNLEKLHTLTQDWFKINPPNVFM